MNLGSRGKGDIGMKQNQKRAVASDVRPAKILPREKRRWARSVQYVGVVYGSLESDRFYFGRLRDYNSNGLGLRIQHRIAPGAILYVIGEDPEQRSLCSEMRQGCFSEIIWIREIERCGLFPFLCGVRIIDPADERLSAQGLEDMRVRSSENPIIRIHST